MRLSILVYSFGLMVTDWAPSVTNRMLAVKCGGGGCFDSAARCLHNR